MAQGIGIKLPIRLGKTGYFEQTFTTLDTVKEDIVNLLLTRKGERPLQPNFGTDLAKVLFENIIDGIDTIIERIIQQAIDFWMPYVILEEIVIDTSPEVVDLNKIKVQITFSVKQVPDRFETIILEFNI